MKATSGAVMVRVLSLAMVDRRSSSLPGIQGNWSLKSMIKAERKVLAQPCPPWPSELLVVSGCRSGSRSVVRMTLTTFTSARFRSSCTIPVVFHHMIYSGNKR